MLRQVIDILIFNHFKLLELQIEKLEQARDNGETIDPDQASCVYTTYFSNNCPLKIKQ